MYQHQGQPLSRPDQLPQTTDTDRMLDELHWVAGALTVIAGLLGAIAVHLIFVGTFLPQIVAQNDLDGASTRSLIAVSDLLGFAAFFALAGLAGRPVFSHGRRHG
jgi:hypothetical protein